MDNQEYEHIQRASTDRATRTTVSNPINEMHHGFALALLQTQFEHAQFQNKNSVRTRESMDANTNLIQQIFVEDTVLLHDTTGRYALLLEAGRINCFVIRAETACRHSMTAIGLCQH